MHRAALATAGAVVAGAGSADLARETPCSGWTLADLLAHMIGQHHGFAATVRDGDAPASAYLPVPFTAQAWAGSVDELLTSFASVDLAGTAINPEFSAQPLPVSFLVEAQLLDTVVHTWDLARSLGHDFTPPDDVAAEVLRIARKVPDDERRDAPGAAFAHALPAADVSPWQQALRMLGRDPAA
jgi:uncharacterized protein (TIGR03086 family)